MYMYMYYIPACAHALTVKYFMPIQNSDLQLKLTRYRNQSVREIDQGLKEKSEKWAKEKKTMMDEKKRLQSELDKVH